MPLYMKNFALLCLCTILLSACNMMPKDVAVIDIDSILKSGKHAQNATLEIKKAHEIYQYNLDVIKEKLASYENKEQAQAYLQSATQQLQTQLNNSQALVRQALLLTIDEAMQNEKANYDIIILKNNILYAKDESTTTDITETVQDRYNAILVTYPPLPKKIDEPNLPADTGANPK